MNKKRKYYVSILKNGAVAQINNRKIKRTPVGAGWRTVYVFGNKILKVNYGFHTDNPAKKEVELFKRIEPEDKKYFAHIYASGHNWIIMKFIKKSNKYRMSKRKEEVIGHIAAKYGLIDIGRYNVIVDQKGIPVIVDYEA